MTPVLFDADAFRCARDLALLPLFRRSAGSDCRFLMTEYIARNELNLLCRDVNDYIECGLLTIHRVLARSNPAYKYYEELRKGRTGKQRFRVHKGEAEAIAWAMSIPPAERPLFVSNDSHARQCAHAHGVPAGDLMDLIVEVVEAGILAYDDAKQTVSVWSDKRRELCRPRDYEGFDETYQRRNAARGNAP